MGMTSTNILSDYKLINFNVTKYLIKNFDNLVRFKRVSRTSMVRFITRFHIRSRSLFPSQFDENKSLSGFFITAA